VAPNTADLANVLAFSNAAADMLANVGAITVDYADKPTRGRIPVCPLYGLTEEAAKAKISVTVAGAPVDNIQVKVENGTITLRNTSGTLLYFR
jgi:HSP20 family molecular chaperone IbpA